MHAARRGVRLPGSEHEEIEQERNDDGGKDDVCDDVLGMHRTSLFSGVLTRSARRSLTGGDDCCDDSPV
jgi:hypothetical protein